MFVDSLLHPAPPTFAPDCSVAEAIATMHQLHHPLLWVTTPEHQLIGMISERIILEWLLQQPDMTAIATTPVAALMAKPPPALTATEAQTPAALARWFSTHDLPSVPIVDAASRLTSIIPQNALFALIQDNVPAESANTTMLLWSEESNQWATADLKLYQQIQALELQIHHQSHALQQSTTKLQALVNVLPDLLIHMNREGIILDVVNSSSLELVCPIQQLKGKTPHEVLPLEAAEERLFYIHRALDTGEMQRYDYSLQLPSGKVCHEEAQIVVCGDDEVLIIIRDVSDRVRDRNILAQERAFLQCLMDSIPDLIFYKDRESRYLGCNQAFADYLNHPKDKILNCVDQDFFSDATAQRFQERDQQVLQTRTTQHYEEWAIYRDNTHTQLLLDIIKTPFMDKNGDVLGIIGIGRNITDRKRDEQNMLNAIAKEKELLDLKSEFITIASHEFRTPLTVIIAATKLMHQFEHRFNAEQRREQYERILRNSQRILSLLEDILVFSQADADALNAVPQCFNVKEFCETISRDLLSLIRETPPFILQFDGSVYAPVDQGLLRHILVNLMSNAFKYATNHQPVTLTVTITEHHLQLVISDQGIGIPPEAIPHLFEPFHRAKNVGDIPGTGLGLAIVKRAVDLHHGTISCESHLNQGTTFTVCLPLNPPLL
ncbi:ATP-binding protein [Spirulina major]|uniref:ATP-binding protein n=1 Tax=Spirulina major TaxID=270636 RepID=UPI0009334461|nr:ATP-binding protein [Spirulina major]